MSESILPHHVADGKNDPRANYSVLSVATHWIGAIAVIVLFFTHEDQWLKFHISLGIVLTIPLLLRVIYRWALGFPRSVNQHPNLNFLSRIVMIGMLVAILLVTISGILLPLFEDTSYPIFSYGEWTVPYSGNSLVYGILEEIHDVAGNAFVPLLALHVFGFAKHMFFDKHGSKIRMLKPFKNGK